MPVASRRRPIAADDLYRLRFVSDPRISPDGSQVAYVVAWVDPDDCTRYRSRLMLAPFDGSAEPRPLTSGRWRDTAPRWSPDGRSLAFVSNRDDDRCQVFLMPLAGGEPRQLTTLKRGAGPAVWSPDGQRLAFSAPVDFEPIAQQEGQSREKGKPPRVKLVQHVQHKADGEGFLESIRHHLFVVDADGAADPRQVTQGDWHAADPAWSPDGQWLAFVSNRERDRDLSPLSDVWVVSASGGRARRLTRHRGVAATPAWSPDGQQLAYLGHERGWTYGVRTELLVVPAEGGAPRSLSGGLDEEIGNAALSDARDPFANAPPSWLPDGSGLLVLVSSHGRVSLECFPHAGALVAGGAPRCLVGGERELAGFSASADGRRLACLVSDPTHPYEVLAVSTEDGSESTITHENDALLDTLALSAPRAFETTSNDGQTVHGWLLQPSGFNPRRRWPLVLEVHGGPAAMYAWTFMHEFQLLAARGYAVLYTNPRGSRGYGEAFTARIFADWGNQDAADCLAALDAAVAERWVDSSRLGVTGGSYGGFMTAWLVGHSDRFTAAVAQRGVYNLVSMYGTSDIGQWFGEYTMGGPVYEREAQYRACSPLSYVQNIRTPLLLIHSENDLRCPIEQAEQMFVQLRRVGKAQTELVRFPEESHNLSRSGRPDRRVERLERIVGWFDRFMGGGQDARK